MSRMPTRSAALPSRYAEERTANELLLAPGPRGFTLVLKWQFMNRVQLRPRPARGRTIGRTNAA